MLRLRDVCRDAAAAASIDLQGLQQDFNTARTGVSLDSKESVFRDPGQSYGPQTPRNG